MTTDAAVDGTRFGGPQQSPGFLMWRATMRWQRLMTSTLAPFGVTHVQFVLLASAWWLNGAGELPSQVRLAAQAGTDVKMTSEVLTRLVSKGLIERIPDAADGRANTLRVTDAGAKLARRAVAAVEDADASFFVAVGSESFTEALTALADAEKG